MRQFVHIAGIALVTTLMSANGFAAEKIELVRGEFRSAFRTSPIRSMMYGFLAPCDTKNSIVQRMDKLGSYCLNAAKELPRQKLKEEMRLAGHYLYQSSQFVFSSRHHRVKRLEQRLSPLVERYPSVFERVIEEIGVHRGHAPAHPTLAQHLENALRAAGSSKKNPGPTKLAYLKTWHDERPVCFVTQFRQAAPESKESFRYLVINGSAIEVSRKAASNACQYQPLQVGLNKDFSDAWGPEVLMLRALLMADYQVTLSELSELKACIPRVRQVTEKKKTQQVVSHEPRRLSVMAADVAAFKRPGR